MYDYEFDHRNSVTYDAYVRTFVALVSYQMGFNFGIDTDENTAFMTILSLRDLDTIVFCAKHLRCLDLSVNNKYVENATSLCFKLGNREIYLILLKIIQPLIITTVIPSMKTPY